MRDSSDIEKWLTHVGQKSQLNVSKIPFRDSKEWILRDGIITHRSGRFFQVAGLRYEWGNEVRSQPIIVQTEIGILGFIMQNYKLLAYAKVEPGNIGSAQLAPTCQATASNLDRVHGGSLPSFGEWFTRHSAKYDHNSYQSEQGMRFFKKQNRNALLTLQEPITHNDNHKWLETDAVLDLMKYDFLVNTDARSTLICAPWYELVNRQPFTRNSNNFSFELARSLKTSYPKSLNDLQNAMEILRAQLISPKLIPIYELSDWAFDDHGLHTDSEGTFEVFQIKVHVEGREITDWDQPIVSSTGEGYVELICGRKDGVLHFLFVLQIEPGLYNMAELGPSFIATPGSAITEQTYASHPEATIILECKQSDEGGRFFQDISSYCLIDMGEVFTPPQYGYWLTLAQTQQLLNEGGWFTNEARSALSLLLTWL